MKKIIILGIASKLIYIGEEFMCGWIYLVSSIKSTYLWR
jgi:hypothetical protein